MHFVKFQHTTQTTAFGLAQSDSDACAESVLCGVTKSHVNRVQRTED